MKAHRSNPVQHSKNISLLQRFALRRTKRNPGVRLRGLRERPTRTALDVLGSCSCPRQTLRRTKVLSKDYVRLGDSQGNREILRDFAGHIKPGDIFWGLASVTSINCVKRRAYYLYWKVGEGGCYAETDWKNLTLPKPEMTPYSED
jgi:hypothetical protein